MPRQPALPDFREPWESTVSHLSPNDQVIWGSRIGTPGMAKSLLGGEPVEFDDKGIITVIRNREMMGEPHDPKPAQIADRICECVNALRGVRDPGPLIAELRTFLLELAWNRATTEDPRLVNLVARLGNGDACT